MSEICSVEGCEEKYYARGWCQRHYRQQHARGLPPLVVDKRHRERNRCAVLGCNKQARARGWCGTHYARWRLHGDPLRARQRSNPLRRFQNYYELRAGSECWWWLAQIGSDGYGRFSDGERQIRAHIWAFKTFVGPVPRGKQLHHLCRNRVCVNPAHLQPVTPQEHVRIHASLKTTCPHGHLYDEGNTYFSPKGERRCRECHRRESRQRKQKQPK